MAKRVAVAGFLHETNTFAPSKATYEHFVQGGGHMPLSKGADILERCAGVNMGIAGAVEVGGEKGWQVEPVLWALAIPSAHVERDAFERLMDDMIAGLRQLGPVDGVYLDLHGAMVCEHLDDGEGEVIARVRAVVGDEVPVAVSLDLHGNVTPKMVEHADILVAYRTYPHVDMAETGRRTAEKLSRLMETDDRPAKAFRQLPYLIPISWQSTDMEPAQGLYQAVADLETGDVVSTSLLMGFPAADFVDCGPSVLAYGRTQAAADAAADILVNKVLAAEEAFAGKSYLPEDGVREAQKIAATASKPVVISDTQDNPGAGGDSNTMGMAKALVACDAQKAAIGLIVDPAAAKAAHAAGEGATVTLALGGSDGVVGDSPMKATFTVDKLSDGKLETKGPFFGHTHMDLGPSACLSIGGVRIVVASHKVQMADQEMYRFVGIEPTEQAILVNKSSVHFRADFAPIAETILVCAAPGPMALNPADLPFTRLRPGIRLSPLGPAFDKAGVPGLGAGGS